MTAVSLKKILNDANKNNYAVAGLVVIGVKIMQKSEDVSESMNYSAEENKTSSVADAKITDLIAKSDRFKVQLNNFQKGNNWQLLHILAENDRLILHWRNAQSIDKIMIVSLVDGSVLGEIHLANQGQQ